jgi:hypothetical protein
MRDHRPGHLVGHEGVEPLGIPMASPDGVEEGPIGEPGAASLGRPEVEPNRRHQQAEGHVVGPEPGDTDQDEPAQ